MRYTVTPDTEITIGETGDMEILVNISLLLQTRRGECPFYRRFGLPMEYFGLPIPAAISVLRNELRDALMDFEPRATLKSVRAEQTPEGRIWPIVEVEL